MSPDDQIIKSRDDKTPVILSKVVEEGTPEGTFKLAEGSECAWLEKEQTIAPDKLRQRIEPWLTALFQAEHFALLAGSGLTHSVYGLATGEKLSPMDPVKFMHFGEEINAEAEKSAEAAGREKGNIEDQIRVANELLQGLEILKESVEGLAGKSEALRGDLKKLFEDFAASILQGEHGLLTADAEGLETAFNYLVSFLMSFASRTGTRDRVQIFTTNYDRYIEAGAEAAGLHLIDRFVGSLAPIFRSSRLDIDMHYNPPGIRGEPRYLEGVARFTKLHGSVDWINAGRNIRRIGLPLGAKSIKPYLEAPGLEGVDALKLMIYPNSAKDRETAAYPYVELFRDFAAAVSRPNSTLICFGYSFGDEHINRVIEDMLTIPSTHLVIIAYNDLLGRIMDLYKRLGRHTQISLLVGNHFGDMRTLVDNYLPKPAIDRTTFRMAELLKNRWTSGQTEPPAEKKDASGEGAQE